MFPKKIQKKAKNKVVIKSLKKENGNKIEKVEEIADYLNSYYCKIGKDSARKCNRIRRQNPMNKITNSFYFKPVTFNELKKTFFSLKNKAGGIDGIHSYTLKVLSNNDNFVFSFLFILNSCFFEGLSPDHFKIAEVKPIFNKGEKDLPGNYRPISLISNLAKIYEKLLHRRLLIFLNNDKLFSKYQFGFRKGVSTKDALASITD